VGDFRAYIFAVAIVVAVEYTVVGGGVAVVVAAVVARIEAAVQLALHTGCRPPSGIALIAFSSLAPLLRIRLVL
jgi:O-acetyl-ADP-ribose deacetylase (regulator of RNase III)